MDYCLKNTLEEIVIAKVEEAFAKDVEICHCIQCKKDVTVFVLNNIKPRYIISTRGMLHEESNTDEQSKISDEIHSILPNAITQVQQNKRPNFDHEKRESTDKLADIIGKVERFTMTLGYNFNFPYFAGDVRDKESNDFLSDVEVTLYINGAVAQCWDANWPNPYHTSDKSKGKFAFWPRATEDPAASPSEMRVFTFKVTFSCADYQTQEVDFEIRMESQKYIINFVRNDYKKEMGTILMEKS